MGWSDSVYGFYASSEFFFNVFLGFLIFAGIILDKMGVRFTALLSGSLMVLGALTKVYALSAYFVPGNPVFDLMNSFWTDIPANAKLASLGFMIFGCGTEMAGVTVSRAIVRWFKGKELALAMGIEMAIARLGVAAIFRISPHLTETYGTVNAPVILCAILLCVGLMLYIVYGILDRKLEEQEGFSSEEAEEPFRFSDLGLIVRNAGFWLIALLCVLFYSAIFPFQKYATEMLQSRVGMSLDDATAYFSYFPLGAAFITPFLGTFLDRIGKGATMLIIGSSLMIIAHATFAFYPFVAGEAISTAVALIALVVLGTAFSLVPATLWPSVPKLIDERVLGSAYSAIFWIQNVGLMAVPILIGKVLESSNVGLAEGAPKDYTLAMTFFVGFGVAALVMALLLKAMDAKRGYGLELPNVKK